VFNIAQVEGYALPEVAEAEAFDPMPDVETFIAATGAAIRIQGDSAHYTPSTDTITMPDRERFFTTTTASAVQNWYANLPRKGCRTAIEFYRFRAAIAKGIK